MDGEGIGAVGPNLAVGKPLALTTSFEVAQRFLALGLVRDHRTPFRDGQVRPVMAHSRVLDFDQIHLDTVTQREQECISRCASEAADLAGMVVQVQHFHTLKGEAFTKFRRLTL